MRRSVCVQRSLLCGCGSAQLFRSGRCKRCYRSHQLSVERFAGLREAALRRDGGCVLCGALKSLIVHHRRPPCSDLPRLATLCRGDHVRVHFVQRLRYGHSPHFVRLWRELHPDAGVQLELPFFETPPRGEQAALFAAA